MTRTSTGPALAPWAMSCDTPGCPTRSSYRATAADLPIEEFRSAGWLVTGTDAVDVRCPSCVLTGQTGDTRALAGNGGYLTVAELIAALSRLPFGAPVVLSEDSEGQAPAHLAVSVSTALFGPVPGVIGALWPDHTSRADPDPDTPDDAVRAVVLWPAESYDVPSSHQPARDAQIKALTGHDPVMVDEDTVICDVCRTEVCEVRVGLGLPLHCVPVHRSSTDTEESPF